LLSLTKKLKHMEKKNLPKIQDLYLDKEVAYKNDVLLTLLNNEPKKEWVKEHPYIKQEVERNGTKVKVPYKYLPIDKIEFLLQKIFKKYRIEILREGTSFNGVYVVVRVHYEHPITGEMEFHDGIGASQLQTAKGTSPSDLININNGALSMAYPMAKTIAIKDACDHFGNLFGANLNRKDTLNYTADLTLAESADDKAHERAKKAILAATSQEQLLKVANVAGENLELSLLYTEKMEELCKG